MTLADALLAGAIFDGVSLVVAAAIVLIASR